MQLDEFTKALADQTRLRVLMLLIGQGELCVCELTAAMKIAQPKISRHLAILRDCHVLQSRKAGLWVYYSLDVTLPEWANTSLQSLYQGGLGETVYQQDAERLQQTGRMALICS